MTRLVERAGYDTFPSTWEDVEKASEYFQEQGIDTVAFGNGRKMAGKQRLPFYFR